MKGTQRSVVLSSAATASSNALSFAPITTAVRSDAAARPGRMDASSPGALPFGIGMPPQSPLAPPCLQEAARGAAFETRSRGAQTVWKRIKGARGKDQRRAKRAARRAGCQAGGIASTAHGTNANPLHRTHGYRGVPRRGVQLERNSRKQGGEGEGAPKSGYFAYFSPLPLPLEGT